jgi:hypothetical protein
VRRSFTRQMDAAYFMTGLGSTICPSRIRLTGVFDIRQKARCKICGIFEHDLMEVSVDANVGEPVYNCMSCSGWWHESCMAATDRQTLPSEPIANVEDSVAPPWRCQECVKNDQYAVQRVLGVVRGEDGKLYLLLEYLGYRYLEVRLESRLVDRNSELRRAYREHANTRSSLSMLYCAGAILDAMWHGQSLKELGMDKIDTPGCSPIPH